MNESQLETLKKLKKFSSELKELTFPSSTISLELAEFVSTAIESFLKKDSKSLDEAFGLTPKKGAPGFPEQRKDTARKTDEMRLAGKSWLEVTDSLNSQNVNYDVREIRRIDKEFEVLTMRERLIKRFNDKDK